MDERGATIEEAALLGHGYLGTEHVLLALLRCGGGLVSRALAPRGLTLERVRATIRSALGEDGP